MDRVAQLPCLVCQRAPVQVHHVVGRIHGGRLSKSHRLVTPLCPIHHDVQWGPRESVHALGHRGFYKNYGIDLLHEAETLWAESQMTEQVK